MVSGLVVYKASCHIDIFITKQGSMCGINLLWHRDAIWWHRSMSTLAHLMACCLTAPSHYMNQCWLIISHLLWYSPKSYFIGIAQDINLGNTLENYTFNIIFPSAKGQWVKHSCHIISCRLPCNICSHKSTVNDVSYGRITCRHWLCKTCNNQC